MRGVLQEFNIFINNLIDNTKWTTSKFVKDIYLEYLADKMSVRASFQDMRTGLT